MSAYRDLDFLVPGERVHVTIGSLAGGFDPQAPCKAGVLETIADNSDGPGAALAGKENHIALVYVRDLVRVVLVGAPESGPTVGMATAQLLELAGRERPRKLRPEEVNGSVERPLRVDASVVPSARRMDQ